MKICFFSSVKKFLVCHLVFTAWLFYDTTLYQILVTPHTSRHIKLLDQIKGYGRGNLLLCLGNCTDYHLPDFQWSLVSTCLQRAFHLHSGPDTD